MNNRVEYTHGEETLSKPLSNDPVGRLLKLAPEGSTYMLNADYDLVTSGGAVIVTKGPTGIQLWGCAPGTVFTVRAAERAVKTPAAETKAVKVEPKAAAVEAAPAVETAPAAPEKKTRARKKK